MNCHDPAGIPGDVTYTLLPTLADASRNRQGWARHSARWRRGDAMTDQKKVWFITGAARGMGLEFARRYSQLAIL